MTTAVTLTPAQLIESVIVKGDLSKLTSEERTQYYVKVCESVGLNPLTKPLEYITLNGKLVLYALKGCTDQLRSTYGVSITEMTESERDGVWIVTVKGVNKDGRSDMAKGAVTITGLKGDALANALMKAETKAKRRVTLSLCGLGVLDETEIETIPQAAVKPVMTLVSQPATPVVKPKEVMADDMNDELPESMTGKPDKDDNCIPLWFPGGTKPHATYANVWAWIRGFEEMILKIVNSTKFTRDEKMQKLQLFVAVNEPIFKNLDQETQDRLRRAAVL